MSMDHLEALRLRLSHEKERLRKAKTEREKTLRAVWVLGIEKEIVAELLFLKIKEEPLPEMTDDELMAELQGFRVEPNDQMAGKRSMRLFAPEALKGKAAKKWFNKVFWICHNRVDRGCQCCELVMPTFKM